METADRVIEKELYTIKEMAALGYPMTQLRYDTHAKGSEAFVVWTPKHGKVLFHRPKYEAWLRRGRR